MLLADSDAADLCRYLPVGQALCYL